MGRVKLYPSFPPTEEELDMINNVMEIKPSTVPGAGRGVFTKRFLPKGTFIGWYRGKIIPDEKNPDKDYTLGIEEDGKAISICAKKYGNFTGLINCYTGSGHPANVNYVDNGRMETVADIQPGEELFSDYGKDYWTGRPDMLYDIALRLNNTIASKSPRKTRRRIKNKGLDRKE
jgi:SET domain-containing protein